MLRPPLVSPGSELRKQWKEDGCVLMPGVFNPISALAAAQAGASALYCSGAGVTNAGLGVPDIALITQSEMVDTASKICQVVSLPVLADADTGYGESLNTFRAVIELERSGLAGIHLEDQVSPKRCGHLDGKALIPASSMVSKLKAAQEARRDPNFVICARTDARGVEGLEGAIERAKMYVDNGADAIFPEGLANVEEFEAFRKSVPGPLLANMTEFGKTDIISFETFKNLGYQMVIYPMTAFRVMLAALAETYETLLTKGTQESLLPKMKTRKELYETLQYERYNQADARWSGNE